MLYTSKHKGSVIDNAVDKMIALIVDSSLSTTSANPVQNKAVTLELNTKLSNKTNLWQNDQNSLPRIYLGDASVTDDVVFRAAKNTTSYFELRKADNTVKFRVDMSTGTLSVGIIPWSLLSSVPSTFTPSAHDHGSFDRATSPLIGASVFSDIVVSKGIVTSITTRSLTLSDIGAAPATHDHTKSQITDFPTSMPSSDVPAWAKSPTKPSYAWSEIESKPVVFTPDTHTHLKDQITDFPTSMPASDVPAWAKFATKPSYTPSEVGASPETHNHDLAYLGIGAKAADSDKLDGYHASAFAAATHGHAILDSLGMYQWNNATPANAYPIGLSFSFVQGSDGFPSYGSVVNVRAFSDDGGTGQIYFPYSSTYGGNPKIRWGNYPNAGWTSWYDFVHAGNALNYTYPVGAIYMSISSTSPATLFGGTWSALPAGRFLRAGTGGSTGGSDTHAHPLSSAGFARIRLAGTNLAGTMDIVYNVPNYSCYYTTLNLGTNAYGGLQEATPLGGNTNSASNVPAYYEIYAWRRTA